MQDTKTLIERAVAHLQANPNRGFTLMGLCKDLPEVEVTAGNIDYLRRNLQPIVDRYMSDISYNDTTRTYKWKTDTQIKVLELIDKPVMAKIDLREMRYQFDNMTKDEFHEYMGVLIPALEEAHRISRAIVHTCSICKENKASVELTGKQHLFACEDADCRRIAVYKSERE